MSRQVIDSSVLDSMLAARGIKPIKRPCCGRPAATPIKYSGYLKSLGYTGSIAIRLKGVIVEMCTIS